MSLFNTADNVLLGSDSVKAVYLGSSVVWSPSTPLQLSAPGDANGLFYYLGTNGVTTTWSNPITSGAVSTVVHVQYGGLLPEYAVDRGATTLPFYTIEGPDLGWIIYDLKSKALQVSDYVIKGRSDSDNDYLRSWILEGSNDATNWEVLDTRTGDTQQSLDAWGTYSAVSSEPHRYLRMRLTGVDSTGRAIMGYGEIEFYGLLTNSVEPTLSSTSILSLSAPGDTNGAFYFVGTEDLSTAWANPITSRRITAESNSQYGSANYYPYASVDRGTSVFPYHSNSFTWNSITYDLSRYRLQVTSYIIMGRADYNGLFMVSWVLEGSQDKVSWDTLDTRVNDTQQGQGVWGTYSAASTEPYRYLRVRVTDLDSSGGNYLVIGEIEFYGTIHY